MTKSIEKNALELEHKDRLRLMLKLLDSFEQDTVQEDQTTEWVREADTRYQAWKEGGMKTISESEVFRRLRNKQNK